jgi:predicted transcriptional regulator
MSELNLFNQPDFSGPDYVPDLDKARLTGQIERIFNCMKDGNWRSLQEIESITDDGQASVSAQMRNLRKNKFGEHTVLKRRRGAEKSGLFEYQLIVNQSTNGHTP